MMVPQIVLGVIVAMIIVVSLATPRMRLQGPPSPQQAPRQWQNNQRPQQQQGSPGSWQGQGNQAPQGGAFGGNPGSRSGSGVLGLLAIIGIVAILGACYVLFVAISGGP